MGTKTIKKEKTRGQKLVWWGWLIIFVPFITITISTFLHAIFSLVYIVLDHYSFPQIKESIDAFLLKLIVPIVEFGGADWILYVWPFGILLLITGYMKRGQEKKK